MIMKLLNKYKTFPVQLRASFWFLICAFMQRGIAAITTPIFTRLMTTFEYGQFNVFNSWQQVLTCFITFNIYGGVYTQGLVKFEHEKKQFISAFQGLLFTLVISSGFLYYLMHPFLNGLMGINYLQVAMMLLIIWTGGVYQLWAQEQRVLLNYCGLVVVTLLYSILSPVMGIVLINVMSDKVTARILGIVIAAILTHAWMFFSQILKGKVFFSKRIWKYALTLALPLLPHYLSQMILSSSDRIMIQKMVGSDEAGIYSLAYSVSLIMTIFNTAMLSTIEPWIYQRIKRKQVDQLSKVAYISMVVIAIVNLILIAFAPEVIKFFAPVSYYEAIWIIPPVAMSVFFIFMYSFYALFEFYFEKTKYISIATFIGAAVNVISNYIFIKKFGYMAAGYTTLICYIIYAILHYFFMQKICDDKLDGIKVYDCKVIIMISIIFIITGFILMMTYNLPLIRYTCICVILLVVYMKRKIIRQQISTLLALRKCATLE